MSFQIDIHPEAVQEPEESYRWYEERLEGLGIRFIDSVNKRLNQIASNPERYPKKKGNFRQASVAVFPYLIIYEVLKKEQTIFVSYIFHSKRNPAIKFKR